MENPEGEVLFELVGAVGTVCLSRPAKLNALTAKMQHRLRAVLTDCERLVGSGLLRALILTGEGRAFCAGQDLSERRQAPGTPAPDLGTSVRENYNPVVRCLTQLPVPVIAAVNGTAAGAGLGLALACDLLVAARSAIFVASFSRVGLVSDSGVGWFLPRRIGAARARSMLLLAERVTAEEAVRMGLANRVVADAELQAAAAELAKQLAEGPTVAFALAKGLLGGSWGRSLDEHLELEAEVQRTAGRTYDYREGVDAFLSRRPPVFAGA